MPRNLVVFYTDQLRKDCLGCYGNAAAETPNIDALARRGVVFENHYASNTVCMPSRASFMTGRHLQAHRLIDNGIALPKSERTIADALAASGYRTCSVGKIHLSPVLAPAETGFEESWALWASGALDGWTGPYYGFEEVRMTLGHGDATFCVGGHYGDWVRRSFPDLAAKAEDYLAGKIRAFGRSSLPLEAHHSTWVAEQSIEFLEGVGDRPFFLYCSFPDPHPPFAVPEPYFSEFQHADFPPPHRKEGENERKPIHYRKAMTERLHQNDGGAYQPLEKTEDDWRTILAATYGMVSLIDAGVGRVLDCLLRLGLESNTVIAFTSDHGDFLGDHYFLYKGPNPCRSLLNLPFIVAGPEVAPGRSEAVMSNVDAMPTLLDLAGAQIPEAVQGRSFAGVAAGEEPDQDHVALASVWSKESPLYYSFTIYGPKYRITYFPNQDDGELYDLERDPHEFENLFHWPEYREVRDSLMLRLLKELGRAEPPSPPVVANW